MLCRTKDSGHNEIVQHVVSSLHFCFISINYIYMSVTRELLATLLLYFCRSLLSKIRSVSQKLQSSYFIMMHATVINVQQRMHQFCTWIIIHPSIVLSLVSYAAATEGNEFFDEITYAENSIQTAAFPARFFRCCSHVIVLACKHIAFAGCQADTAMQ